MTRRVSKKPKNHGRPWTEEEENFLLHNISYKTVDNLARKMGRSKGSLLKRLNYLGFTQFDLHPGINLTEFAKASGIHRTTLAHFRDKKGLKVGSKANRIYIKVEDFWEWAEANPTAYDFKKIPPNVLIPEPEWVHKLRTSPEPFKLNKWSSTEIAELEKYIREGKYDAIDIAEKLGRTEVAIQRKANALGYYQWAPNNKKRHKGPFTKDELKQLEQFQAEGLTIHEMSIKLGRTSSSVYKRILTNKNRDKKGDTNG